MVRDAPVLSFDTETSGLTLDAKVVGWVFYAPEFGSTYIPVRHEQGGNLRDYETFEAELAKAFADRARLNGLTIGHNVAFDLRMARRHGVVIRGRLEDTMINAGLIDDYAPSYSLESCAECSGVTPKKAQPMYLHLARVFGGVADKKQMSNFWKMRGDDPMVIEYAEGDAITTYELWENQQSRIQDNGLERVHELECRLIPHIDQMNAIGMRVDSAKAQTIMDEIEANIAEAQKPLGTVNVNSSKQVAELYRLNGITDFATTANGAPSFRIDWLATNEIGQAILKVRQLKKARDSFITPLIDTYNVNGRVHAQLNQSKSDDYGAIGGRLSCTDPNMQAFPKRNKAVGQVVRQLIVPDDGQSLYESDFSQQEPRLFTHYSECVALIEGYTATPFVDIHTIASRLMQRPRDEAKRLGLGILTGLGYKGLAEKNGMSLSDATEAHKSFMRAFPEIKQFQNDAKVTAMNRGNVRTLLGRKMTFPDKSKAYTAVSRIIQGSGADHTKTALLDACDYCAAHSDQIQMLMTIHDSFMYQTGNEYHAKEVQRILDAAAPKLGVIIPIPTETGSGRNWAEASYGGK